MEKKKEYQPSNTKGESHMCSLSKIFFFLLAFFSYPRIVSPAAKIIFAFQVLTPKQNNEPQGKKGNKVSSENKQKQAQYLRSRALSVVCGWLQHTAN